IFDPEFDDTPPPPPPHPKSCLYDHSSGRRVVAPKWKPKRKRKPRWEEDEMVGEDGNQEEEHAEYVWGEYQEEEYREVPSWEACGSWGGPFDDE
ncbi:hypothetical protein C0991_002969, partial [Blastosporella zonata]